MPLVTEIFSAYTVSPVSPQDTYLPLCNEAKADLLNLLSEDEDYTYAALKSDTSYEAVKLHVEGGIILMERGIEGTKPVSHRKGTCVSLVSPLVMAAIKDLICNYSCCSDEECPCAAPSMAQYSMPAFRKGSSWQGWMAFNGDTPMTLTVQNAPAWLTAVQSESNGQAMLSFSGVPTTDVDTTIMIVAANCGGTHVMGFQYTLHCDK